MAEKKKSLPPIPLCRFEELAERENRLRQNRLNDRAARKRGVPPPAK